ncbi:hypothetical protein [Sansalvadorimonas verongulae]|uniref:hypothetical protein n=1 Tax=Sansalvadorimonas verongulae TaxID=2172824 RepID=UPI0012BC7939|nr:hypothetical protein [Sansalvadorimonas verongulae]MTI14751.1 hypothetical protein [Sansalvadorimonas verongulae]
MHSKVLSITLFPLLLISSFITPEQALATWGFETFKSGSLHHQVATSSPQKNGRELEVFCSSTDPRLTLALYLPKQRFRRREPVEITLQIDRKRSWKIPATRHAMAITAPDISDAVIEDLSSGNRARITFPISSQRKQTEIFHLRRSSVALSSIVSKCG